MINFNKITILVASVTLLCLEISSNESFDYSSRGDVKEYIEEISNKHGFESDKLLKLLGSAVYQEKVVRIMNRQPEGTMTWSRYKEMMVSDSRISAGKEFIKLHKEDLNKAEDLYGVPAEIIASIIGIETRYGRITGNIRVLDSLMTLSFNYPRRSKFFKIQLEEFLLLSREEGFDPESLEGSIAGAMGYGQFMPDSYRKYAVDFDSDGVRDILTNPVDAIGSIAAYLSRHGWRRGEAITIRVTEPGDEELLNVSLKPYTTVEDVRKQGVKVAQDVASEASATLMHLKGDGGSEYWLGLHNFYVITRYNHSRLYAMAVFQLGEAVAEDLRP